MFLFIFILTFILIHLDIELYFTARYFFLSLGNEEKGLCF